MRRSRKAFSLPVVLLLCALMILVLTTLLDALLNAKVQVRTTFAQLRIRFLGQAGLQHARLKLRSLPVESYDAAALARGICPFANATGRARPQASSHGSRVLLDELMRDVTTTRYPFPHEWEGSETWQYQLGDADALMAGDALVSGMVRDPAANSTDAAARDPRDLKAYALELTVRSRAPARMRGVSWMAEDVLSDTVSSWRLR